jgi:hypothetical protein
METSRWQYPCYTHQRSELHYTELFDMVNQAYYCVVNFDIMHDQKWKKVKISGSMVNGWQKSIMLMMFSGSWKECTWCIVNIR